MSCKSESEKIQNHKNIAYDGGFKHFRIWKIWKSACLLGTYVVDQNKH